MFNNELKKEAVENLENAVKKYDKNRALVEKKAIVLFNLREKSGNAVIKPVENYINKLANSPKEFDKSFSKYKAEYKTFNDLINELNAEAEDTNFKAGGSAAAGIGVGVGTAALMPAAAMAVATTFGTASTGTAIASLGGAAATNAALAWLGGGALAAGGTGMAGGSAFLALAGPIGIGIGAVGIIGSGLFASSKNKEIAQKANEKRKQIELANATLKASNIEIGELITLTDRHQNGVLGMLVDLKANAPKDYSNFNEEEKQKIGSLVNHINSLSKLLNKKVV